MHMPFAPPVGVQLGGRDLNGLDEFAGFGGGDNHPSVNQRFQFSLGEADGSEHGQRAPTMVIHRDSSRAVQFGALTDCVGAWVLSVAIVMPRSARHRRNCR